MYVWRSETPMQFWWMAGIAPLLMIVILGCSPPPGPVVEETPTMVPFVDSTYVLGTVDSVVQGDLRAYRDTLSRRERASLEWRRCWRDIGGWEGYYELAAGYDGVEVQLADDHYELTARRSRYSESRRLFELHREAVRWLELQYASYSVLAGRLRSLNFEVPPDEDWKARNEVLSQLLWHEPFSDDVWLAIRDEAWTSFEIADELIINFMTLFRYVLPGCGER